uniref:C2 domain-containing protein n=1 Tax=Monopterus albus TaxID=43700 RepID=A0A3Q3JUC2_MONAL
MSTVLDETAADVPVRDIAVMYQNARARQDISRVSREELEDRFLRLHEETLDLKQHIHTQDDKIKKLGTKLMRLVKDRGRMEHLAAGGAHPVSRVRDIEMEEMMEDLQEKVRALQSENEGLKQRFLVAKQQLINSQNSRPSPYGHVQSRVNSGLKKLRDDTSSPFLTRPKSDLLEEARAEIRNLENVIESQRSHMEELEGASELLREELRKKEAEYEERLLQVRQQQTSRLRSHVNNNVMMMKLQKQLADRSNTVTELEGRFLQLQESQRILKAGHDAAMLKVDELAAQLKDERLKSLDLEKRLQSSAISKMTMEQLQEHVSELEQERDLLKQNNEKLVNSAFDVSQQQKWQIQEQQLKLQITQLETALKADLIDKNEILDKIKAERDTNEKLTEENKKLQIQFLEQKQKVEELNGRLRLYSRENEYDVAELTEALLLIRTRKSQQSGDLGFLKDVEEGGSTTVRELRAAHAETIQELEKTRNILSMESKISKDYKAELESVLRKMESDRGEYKQKLEQQAQLLDTRAAKIKKLEAQLKDIAYGAKTYVFKPDITDEDEADKFDEPLHLQHGENLLELQIVSATLSPSTLETLGDSELSTFFTYSFFSFGLHSTPVVTGHSPKYGFTSKYVVAMDDQFLDYLHRCSVTVELHQALGLDWRTLASGRIRLQQLLEQDGKRKPFFFIIGAHDEVHSFGSVDYWLRLRIPLTETIRLYKEKVKPVGYTSTALSEDAQVVLVLQNAPCPSNVSDTGSYSSWNVLLVTVQRCRDLQARGSQQLSPYVVYKFFDFSDYPTATIHDCCDPHFSDLKSYSVLMDVELDQYLKSEALQFYVFDYKEEQMDMYLGKARVPLLSLCIICLVLFIPKDTPVHGPAGLSEEAENKDKLLTDTDLEELLQEEKEARDPSHHSTSLSSKEFNGEEEEESHFSEGQLVTASSQSCSDDSEISEEIIEAIMERSLFYCSDMSYPLHCDPCLGPQASERVRLEIVSLSLKPGSRVTRDSSVVRLFVEYSFLDLLTEETPLSLIRFTVVSEPPEEEEQEKECEDVGVAFLRIPEILEKQQDLTDTGLSGQCTVDSLFAQLEDMGRDRSAQHRLNFHVTRLL